MLKHKTTVALLLLALSAIAMTARTKLFSNNQASGRNDASNQKQTDAEKAKKRFDYEAQFPEVDYNVPSPDLNDPEKRAKRTAKNSHYDKHSFGISDPTPRVNETSVETEWSLHVPALPTAQSDVILVGDVLQASAHLSNNKRGIYSEFTVRVNEVLKHYEATQVAPGSLIAVERLGGTVKYPAGNKRIISIAGQGMPRVNRRYIFFLNTTEYGQDFRLLTGYELKAGKIFPLDDSTLMKAYKEMAEEAFLDEVRDAVARPL